MFPISASSSFRIYSTSANLNDSQQQPEPIEKQIRSLQESIEKHKNEIIGLKEMQKGKFNALREVNKESLPLLDSTDQVLEDLEKENKELGDKVAKLRGYNSSKWASDRITNDKTLSSMMSGAPPHDPRNYPYYGYTYNPC